jgi:hypothetical protein
MNTPILFIAILYLAIVSALMIGLTSAMCEGWCVMGSLAQ